MLVTTLVSFAFFCAQPTPTPTPTPLPASPANPPAAPKPVVEKLVAEAEKLRPLVKTDAARAFLGETAGLPEPKAVTIYRNREKGLAISADEWATLPKQEQETFKPRECPPGFFYSTGYGSPLVYVRLLDLVAEHDSSWATPKGKRVLDFGYGSIGQLKLLSMMGVGAAGIEVEPLFTVLYREYMTARPGEPLAFHGRWPAEATITEGVRKEAVERGQFDLITSKNTLKAGYVHPTPPKGKTVDERQLVKLGVGDDVFLNSVRESLKPGGLFVIYNICPAQSPAEDLTKPYVPWADGKSPFTREQFAAAGLEVVAFDTEDNAWALDCWKALGYDEGKPREEMAKDLFVWYTIARRPSAPAPNPTPAKPAGTIRP